MSNGQAVRLSTTTQKRRAASLVVQFGGDPPGFDPKWIVMTQNAEDYAEAVFGSEAAAIEYREAHGLDDHEVFGPFRMAIDSASATAWVTPTGDPHGAVLTFERGGGLILALRDGAALRAPAEYLVYIE